MTVRFAILGAGRIGQVHAKAVASTPQATLVAIADPVAAAAQSVSDAYGCDIRTIEEIRLSDDVDAVVICTPTDTHADLIEQFARVGKAVFCEKPVDLSIDRVRDCIKVVAEEKATLMVGFNRRFDPDFMALKRPSTTVPSATSKWSRSPAAIQVRRLPTISNALAASSAI